MGSYKACPKCSCPATLDAPACASCGHQFRTQFVDRTQAFTAVQAQPAYAGQIVQPAKKTLVWPYIVAAVFGVCLLGSCVALIAPGDDTHMPSKMDVASQISQGMPASEVRALFGDPFEIDRQPGPLPNEVWTYHTFDGTVVVEVYLGKTVSDVYTY